MDVTGFLATVAACLVAVVLVFQLALAAGAPWAGAAYGGRVPSDDGILPTRYRVASLASAVVLTAVAWLILAAGSVLARGPVPVAGLTPLTWVLAGLFLLNTLGNLRGRHPVERWGFGAITALLAALCVAIAVSR